MIGNISNGTRFDQLIVGRVMVILIFCPLLRWTPRPMIGWIWFSEGNRRQNAHLLMGKLSTKGLFWRAMPNDKRVLRKQMTDLRGVAGLLHFE